MIHYDDMLGKILTQNRSIRFIYFILLLIFHFVQVFHFSFHWVLDQDVRFILEIETFFFFRLNHWSFFKIRLIVQNNKKGILNSNWPSYVNISIWNSLPKKLFQILKLLMGIDKAKDSKYRKIFYIEKSIWNFPFLNFK